MTIVHSDGMIEAVTLGSGDQIKVGTLLWVPPRQSSPLIRNLVENVGLSLDDSGYVMTDETQQTNVSGLWAAGEVKKCCSNALDSAAAGSRAAKAIIRSWFPRITKRKRIPFEGVEGNEATRSIVEGTSTETAEQSFLSL